MNRRDFKRLATIRLRDAQALLRSRNYSGAYYLAGYSVECALKACIAMQTKAGDWPPGPEITRELYTHDLTKLLKQAKLDSDLKNAMNANTVLFGYWGTVRDWSEQSRYEVTSQQKAVLLFEAITDPNEGVLKWIQQYW